ncbi:hypothetical protein QQ045_025838 [Rhodiola kirilowii]
MTLPNDIDLLNPPAELEKRKHKLKRLVQSPNSFFMDVKCQGCFNITTVFSHSQTVATCSSCQTILCQPTGGKARLTEDTLRLTWVTPRCQSGFVISYEAAHATHGKATHGLC